MSVYGVDRSRRVIEFLYKVAGLGTGTLSRLKNGDVLSVVGPLGQGFRLQDSWRSILLLARGVGLATLAPLAEECFAKGIRTTAILSARSPDLIMSRERLEAVGARVFCVSDAEKSSDTEHLEHLMDSLFKADRPDAMFTCGSQRLLLLMKRLSTDWGIPAQVALEEQMACGLGMCFCCVKPFAALDGQVTYRRVCTEGPVFDLREVI
jgi:dihydroorotate dehydrogenase electron transfer subunit